MRIINIHGAKGGQGTTTIACTLALQLAHAGQTVRLFALDPNDARAVLGLPNGTEDVLAVLGLTVTGGFMPLDKPDVLVRDLGPTKPGDHAWVPDDDDTVETWVVARNEHLALRRAVTLPTYDRLILIHDPGRPLDVDDFADVLDMVPTVIAYDLEVARSIDAGLLAMRAPAALRVQLDTANA